MSFLFARVRAGCGVRAGRSIPLTFLGAEGVFFLGGGRGFRIPRVGFDSIGLAAELPRTVSSFALALGRDQAYHFSRRDALALRG